MSFDEDDCETTRKNSKITSDTQYTKNGNVFKTCGPTSPTLPSGIYDFANSMFGPFLQEKVIETDELITPPNSQANELIKEIKHFWTLKEKFKQFGLIHKRGFLLHGPPGTGKTSIINLVAKEIAKINGLFIFSKTPSNLGSFLSSIRVIEPERKVVVVFEDLDNVLYEGEEELLALLDGQSSVDGVSFIATTNFLTKLPERIIKRPSRFDRVMEIGFPSSEIRYEYLKSKNLGLSDEELDKWTSGTQGFSLAFVKELVISVLCLGNSFDSEVKRLREWAEIKSLEEEF